MELESIKKFFRGFKKIDYTVELLDHFDKNVFDFGESMYRAQTLIDEKLSNLPIREYTYGIKDYTAEIADERYVRRLMDSGKSIYLIKQSYRKYDINKLTENDVTITIISKGLDKKIWKFDIKMYFIYYCFNNMYDIDILGCGSVLANGFINDMNINMMLYDENWYINIPEAIDVDKLTSRQYSAYTRVYGDMEYLKNYGLTDTVDILHPDNSIIEECDAEYSIEEFIEQKALVVDVIRKTRPDNNATSIRIS